MATPLRVVMLPPIDWRRRTAPAEGPDPTAVWRRLEALGIELTILDPMAWPCNPLRGRHPLLQGIDPLRALRVLLLHRHVDAVVCVFEGPALILALLRRLAGFSPRLLMWDLGLSAGWRLRDRILDLVVPRLDEILVLGSNQCLDIAARWPRHAPVRCIGHSIDTKFWQPPSLPADSQDGAPDSSQDGARDGPRDGPREGIVLSVGDDAGRDHELLLQATVDIRCRLVIRADRALVLDPERHRHVRQLRARIRFTELRDLYAAAALVVVPLRDRMHAGGVTAVLEAAAMGRAMVVSDSAGIRDWLRDGETCLVVPCGDAGALAAAIPRLLGDRALRSRLGTAARAFVVRHCTPDIFARRLARALARPDSSDGSAASGPVDF